MPAELEVLGDGTRCGKKSLGLTRRLKPLHTPLALPSRLMRVFCTVIEIAMLAMFHPWQDLALSGSLALQCNRGEVYCRDFSIVDYQSWLYLSVGDG